jgi:hypothetical protein
MKIAFMIAGLLLVPTLLQAQNAGEYWRDRQYADRVRAEERRHEIEIERLRAKTALEVAKQNRRHYHYYRPRIVGHQGNVVSPTPSKTSIITYQGFNHPRSTVRYRGVGYSESTVNYSGTGFSYSSSYKKRVRTIGIGGK